MKGKNDQFKSCLIKLPKLAASVAVSAKPSKDDSPAPPASPTTSPTTTSKVPTASALPATATRCLSLVRYLTLVREQQHAQAQAQHLSSEPDAAEVSETAAVEVVSSSGSVSRAASVVHVMTALERRLASLTVLDASALVSTSQGASALSVSATADQLGASEPNSVGSDSPVVISALDLASASVDPSLRGGGDVGARESLTEHVLLSPGPSVEEHSPMTLRTTSEEFVLI